MSRPSKKELEYHAKITENFNNSNVERSPVMDWKKEVWIEKNMESGKTEIFVDGNRTPVLSFTLKESGKI